MASKVLSRALSHFHKRGNEMCGEDTMTRLVAGQAGGHEGV